MSHNEKIDGFKIIAHEPNANDISNNVKQILANNNKSIEVYLGPHQKSYVGASEFKDQCTSYFERYFEALVKEETQVLPWKIPDEFKRITETMVGWCKETNDFSSLKGLVLHSFSILKHSYRHGFTKEVLQDCLEIKRFSEAPIMIIYNPHERALLLLRKAESKKLSIDITLGFNDVKLFILLFHDILTKSSLKLIPLVVTDEKVNPNNLDCHLCVNHVLSEKEFTDTGNFNFWWVERESYFETKYKGEINEVLSKNLLAKLTGVLAAALLYPNYIPRFTDEQDVLQQMEDLAVLLTPAQMDVYYSYDNHMIIKGGFGCGKSIIAAAMLQKISESLEEDEKLFYICHDPRSELLNQMAKNNQEEYNDKVATFRNKDGLKLSAIIEHITKPEQNGKTNLVIDEYDGEDMDEAEAEKLNYVFKESFKKAFIVLIPQPIKKERVINKVLQKKNQFDKLNTMKTHDLTWNMRNSIEIYKLVETTKDVLSEEKTIFVNPRSSRISDQLTNIKESAGENSNTNQIVSTQKDPEEPEFKEEIKENPINSTMGLDEAHAVVGSPVTDDSSGNSTESKFAYAVVDKTGHKINTKKPVLFELRDKEEFLRNLSLIAIFKKVFTISSKHVVLHFNTETNAIPSALNFAFEHYSKIQKKVTTSYKEFESSKESILVCSYPTFRGLEYPVITVWIDRDIYFVQHYLVEILARCTSELYVVVFRNSSALARITTEWKTKELVNQWGAHISEKTTQRKECEFRIDENVNTIYVTFKSEYYRKLEEAFNWLSSSQDETFQSIAEHRAREIIIQKR